MKASTVLCDPPSRTVFSVAPPVTSRDRETTFNDILPFAFGTKSRSYEQRATKDTSFGLDVSFHPLQGNRRPGYCLRSETHHPKTAELFPAPKRKDNMEGRCGGSIADSPESWSNPHFDRDEGLSGTTIWKILARENTPKHWRTQDLSIVALKQSGTFRVMVQKQLPFRETQLTIDATHHVIERQL